MIGFHLGQWTLFPAPAPRDEARLRNWPSPVLIGAVALMLVPPCGFCFWELWAPKPTAIR